MCARGLAATVLIGAALISGAGCDSGEQPSRPPLTLIVPSPVEGRYVSCPTCEAALSISVEFTITVGDPGGRGGTVQEVRVTATDRSLRTVIGSNSRPNPDFPYPNRTIPAGGTLELEAGIVISPAPPAEDEIVIAVLISLEDGRTAATSAPMVIPAGAKAPALHSGM